MSIKLETTQTQYEHLAERANARGTTVKVERAALMALFIDYGRMRDSFARGELTLPPHRQGEKS
ncbi:hypothetical protein [Parvibaculum sp.]|uniref:hypothetical protein n=1 Tax=Parvibaculum sp. TaxID=2024848 RepID=UPI00261723BA|nr:hypothetical protein [Parvibaculum sp.]MCW5727213.1 hypothetical protein [Parvibaculum sp.]